MDVIELIQGKVIQHLYIIHIKHISLRLKLLNFNGRWIVLEIWRRKNLWLLLPLRLIIRTTCNRVIAHILHLRRLRKLISDGNHLILNNLVSLIFNTSLLELLLLLIIILHLHIIIIIEVLLTLLLIQKVCLLLLELLLVVILHHELLLLLLLWIIVIISLLLGILLLILHKLWILLLHIIIVLAILDIIEILSWLLLLIPLSKIHELLAHHILHILNDIWILDCIWILKPCCLIIEVIIVVALSLILHCGGSHVHGLEVLEVHVLHVLHILKILHVLVHVIHVHRLLTHKVLWPRLLVVGLSCDRCRCLFPLRNWSTVLLNCKSNDVNRDLSLWLRLLRRLWLRARSS